MQVSSLALSAFFYCPTVIQKIEMFSAVSSLTSSCLTCLVDLSGPERP